MHSVVDDDVWLVGIGTYSALPIDQMKSIAEATGSMADLDGDDVADPLVFEIYATDEITSAISDAIDAIRAAAGIAPSFATVTLEVRCGSAGDGRGVSPASYTSVDISTAGRLDFDVTYDTTPLGASTEPRTSIVELAFVGDGVDLETVSVAVEIPPS